MLRSGSFGGGLLNVTEVNKALSSLKSLNNIQFHGNFRSWFGSNQTGYFHLYYTQRTIIFLSFYKVSSASATAGLSPHFYSIVDQTGATVFAVVTEEHRSSDSSENIEYKVNRISGQNSDYYGDDQNQRTWEGYVEIVETKVYLYGVSTGDILQFEMTPVWNGTAADTSNESPLLNTTFFSYYSPMSSYVELSDSLTAVNQNKLFNYVLNTGIDKISHTTAVRYVNTTPFDSEVMSCKINGAGRQFKGLDTLADWVIGFSDWYGSIVSGASTQSQSSGGSLNAQRANFKNELEDGRTSIEIDTTKTHYSSIAAIKHVVSSNQIKAWQRYLYRSYDGANGWGNDADVSIRNRNINFITADFSSIFDELFNTSVLKYPSGAASAGEPVNIRLVSAVLDFIQNTYLGYVNCPVIEPLSYSDRLLHHPEDNFYFQPASRLDVFKDADYKDFSYTCSSVTATINFRGIDALAVNAII